MGYYSNVVNFQQESFGVIPGTTPEQIRQALDGCGSDWGDYLDYWFTKVSPRRHRPLGR